MLDTVAFSCCRVGFGPFPAASQGRPRIRALVVDSIAFSFRHATWPTSFCEPRSRCSLLRSVAHAVCLILDHCEPIANGLLSEDV